MLTVIVVRNPVDYRSGPQYRAFPAQKTGCVGSGNTSRDALRDLIHNALPAYQELCKKFSYELLPDDGSYIVVYPIIDAKEWEERGLPTFSALA